MNYNIMELYEESMPLQVNACDFNLLFVNEEDISPLEELALIIKKGENHQKEFFIRKIPSMISIPKVLNQIVIQLCPIIDQWEDNLQIVLIQNVYEIIDNIIKDVQCGNISINNDDIKNLYKRIIRKRNMDVERGIIMAVRLTTYNIMYGNEQKLVNELEGRYDIISNLNDIVKHVFRKSAVQIIR